jgi:hypothetical protein
MLTSPPSHELRTARREHIIESRSHSRTHSRTTARSLEAPSSSHLLLVPTTNPPHEVSVNPGMHASATYKPSLVPRGSSAENVRWGSVASVMDAQERRRSAGDMRLYRATPNAPVPSAWARSPPRSSSLTPQLHALRLGDTAAHVHGHRDVVECASWSLTSPPRTALRSLPRGWAATEEEGDEEHVARRRITAADEDEKQTPSICKKVSRLVSRDGARLWQRLHGAWELGCLRARRSHPASPLMRTMGEEGF